MKKYIKAFSGRLCTAVLAGSALALFLYCPEQALATWSSVKISGAGAMVTGMLVHPLQQGLVYIRTDVGGCYRWDLVNSKWIPLNDSFTFEGSDWGDYYACESLAIDPNNVNVLYYAGGLSSYTRNGSIFKSTDQGATWTNLTGISLYMSGNGDRRWAGERLAVSPSNSSVVLFGSRKNGMWRSINSGTTWTQVAFSTVTDGYGVQSVAFDRLTAGKAYAAVSTLGVYISTDSGATWTSIGGSTSPRRITVGPDGTLWYTTGTGVSKYSGGVWTNYTVGGAAKYDAVAVNPSNANDIIVEKGGETGGSYTIWRTLNAGTTWTQQTTKLSSTATWAAAPTRFSPASMAFDPFNTTTIWGGQWRADNVSGTILSGTVAWVQYENGHEEDVAGTMITPPSGKELLVGVFDDDGFAITNPASYPAKQLGIVGSWQGHTWGMAYEESNPLNMLRIGGQKFYGGPVGSGVLVSTSTDGGATWNSKTTFPSNAFPLACAISATNPQRMVVICDANHTSDTSGNSWSSPVASPTPWYYTIDGGTTWNAVTGLPVPSAYPGPWGQKQILAADHVNGSKFYYLDVTSSTSNTTGKVYRSVSSGSTFAETNPASLLPANMRSYSIKAQPGTEGSVWVSMDNWPSSGRSSTEGLYHSTDSGVTWTQLANVNRAYSFGFGAPPSGSTTPALYLYGRVNSATVDSIYRSLDLGVSWGNIQNPNNYMSDTPYLLEGSRQNYGRVFLGTGGRGFYYGP